MSTWTPQGKSSASYTPETKSSATWTPEAKNSAELSALLMESGDYLLQENEDLILLELSSVGWSAQSKN
jgi:hypothetical protein